MKLCSVENCGKPFQAKGYCKSHWYYAKKYGSVDVVTSVKQRKIDIEEQRKTCTICNQRKNFDEFWNSASGVGGKYSRCIPCVTVYDYQEYKMKASALPIYYSAAKNHNIEYSQIVKMLEDQNNECIICGSNIGVNGKVGAIDHDHRCCDKRLSCGKCVRGILCRKCNSGIGLLGDSVDNVKNAYEYLLKNQTNS